MAAGTDARLRYDVTTFKEPDGKRVMLYTQNHRFTLKFPPTLPDFGFGAVELSGGIEREFNRASPDYISDYEKAPFNIQWNWDASITGNIKDSNGKVMASLWRHAERALDPKRIVAPAAAHEADARKLSDAADSVLIDEARTPLIISNKKEDPDEHERTLFALEVAGSLQEGRDYMIHRQSLQIELNNEGRGRVTRACEGRTDDFAHPVARTDLIRQALSALYMFERDRHYILLEGKIAIVDEFTGRVMPDRSWERGLNQMIEAKEGVELTGRSVSIARLTYQRFFPRYLHLCGRTGTGREVTQELWSGY